MNIDELPDQVSNHSPTEQSAVKSNAIVKYSSVASPALYATLQSNTDIKLAPSNWLTSFAESYGLNHAPPLRSSVFSSFRMANMFPDCVGEVDVVSDAENIKKLLQIPYSTHPVSMMVHRVENTLLIDEFDIHKHLLSRAEDEWRWLRKYFLEHILSTMSTKDKHLTYRDKSRNALLQKSLVSKFLHHSLAEREEKKPDSPLKPSTTLPISTRCPVLPEPLEEGLPSSNSDHNFSRNVVWTFEDIQMLLGTDMPIFGGPSRPCISLRLRDANKPISVLTGIDYWLDNLMSNVPEVVMCYHLDGIVQKYELLKTEDLPNLKESRFSPKIIRDVAQNILSFLKANATKAGHTYWLFKGTNDDAVKLYDLTSLCSESMDEKDQNPFTVPVGMLLYRVARNMKATGNPSQNSTIRTLLKNCLSLLCKQKYPQIVTSVHFMLADVYIPSDTDPSSPELLSLSNYDQQDFDGSNEDDERSKSSVPVTLLSVSHSNSFSKDAKYSQQSQPAITSIEDRCQLALNHVIEGLDCLQYFNSSNTDKMAETNLENDQGPKMAKPSEAIPMPYTDQKKQKKEKGKKKKRNFENQILLNKCVEEEEMKSLKAVLYQPNGATIPSLNRLPDQDNPQAWKEHLLSLLKNKACLVYSIIVEREIKEKRYRSALVQIQNVLNCCGENKKLVGLMLSRAGDCFFSLSAKHTPSKDDISEEERYPSVSQRYFTESNLNQEDALLAEYLTREPDELFDASTACYKRSLELYCTEDTIRKAANAYNTFATKLTNKASDLVEKPDTFDEEVFSKCISKAEEMFLCAIKFFELVKDVVNKALVTCNTGRLSRIKTFTPQISASASRKHHDTAIELYLKALSLLENRRRDTVIWDAIYWELSTALYMYATYQQENYVQTGVKSREEIEREVVDLLQRALKYCDVNTVTSKQPLYQYRAATLYHRIASLYHKAYRNGLSDETKMKQIYQLCQINYTKASELFSTLEYPLFVLRIELERISLCEYIAGEAKSLKTQIKNLQNGLAFVTNCKKALESIVEKTPLNEGDLDDREQLLDFKERDMLTDMLQNGINFLLKTLIKHLSCSNKPKNTDLLKEYKNVYVISLKKDPNDKLESHLIKVIDLIPK